MECFCQHWQSIFNPQLLKLKPKRLYVCVWCCVLTYSNKSSVKAKAATADARNRTKPVFPWEKLELPRCKTNSKVDFRDISWIQDGKQQIFQTQPTEENPRSGK